ncbi:MAG: IS5 family transposase ISCARN107 [Steroidobacteraceae bacterium]|nr:IS5 family transposase ISCARN107 [Steroidobacteraceae bacterium]
MKQQTLMGLEKYGKTTRRAKFLAEMDRLVPWQELGESIEPIYPKGTGEAGGRPPVPLERMLRIYFLQLWFNLSDPAVEEALYDSASMRSFAGVDLGREPVPDESTVCKFRHLLERNGMGKILLKAMNTYLRENGIKVGNGTIVDATIIGGPSSTKNWEGKRDLEMHQAAKGKQWYFGMKAHIGVDSKTKIIHTIKASAANVADALALPHLLHGRETRVWGNQAYREHTEAMRAAAPRARDFTHHRYRWGKPIDERIKAVNRTKAIVRSKVEHTIGVIKRVFGFQKVRYRGLAKNLHRLEVTAALANLSLVRRRLLTA